MKNKILSSVLRFFKSVKLTIVLLIYITGTSILTTLIPQGNEIVFYQQQYHPFISWLVLSIGLNDFFRSFLFLLPVALFTINLIVCMLSRFIGVLSHNGKKRFGPDIIHLGIFLLIAGALVTFFYKQESSFYMGEGDQVIVAQKYVFTLDSFEEIRYPDGRPKEWISKVSVTKDDKEIVGSFPIEVNKPLEINGLAVYQSSYYDQQFILLTDNTGKDITLPEGHPLPDNADNLYFIKVEEGEDSKDALAIFEQWENDALTGRYEYSFGSYIGNYLIKDKITRTMSGLHAVLDPGFVPIVISFFIIMAGLALTFIQKIGDKKI